MGSEMARTLWDSLRADGTLPESKRLELSMLVASLESGLS
jgi:hypothetical protein